VPKNQRREVIAKIGWSSPEYRHLLMRAIHQLPVPKEAKQEHETEGCNKCDEEFFQIHKPFLLSVCLIPADPKPSSQNARAMSTQILPTRNVRV
jgi:hypothetical protein